VTEYYPTFIEVVMSVGNWAIGFLILTILLKGAIGILIGEVKFNASAAEKSPDFAHDGATATSAPR
jgi:molybdopterin-containing oxidoreductase family membrane subunit